MDVPCAMTISVRELAAMAAAKTAGGYRSGGQSFVASSAILGIHPKQLIRPRHLHSCTKRNSATSRLYHLTFTLA